MWTLWPLTLGYQHIDQKTNINLVEYHNVDISHSSIKLKFLLCRMEWLTMPVSVIRTFKTYLAPHLRHMIIRLSESVTLHYPCTMEAVKPVTTEYCKNWSAMVSVGLACYIWPNSWIVSSDGFIPVSNLHYLVVYIDSDISIRSHHHMSLKQFRAASPYYDRSSPSSGPFHELFSSDSVSKVLTRLDYVGLWLVFWVVWRTYQSVLIWQHSWCF